MSLKNQDVEIFELLQKEELRQKNTINLIASENYVSVPVLQAMGSSLTNKYAEGYPGKRYYGGCEFVDGVETLAINRIKELFGAEHANVQPHSGACANFAVYLAAAKPGDTILAMGLDQGGHLTHGANVNFSGSFYNIVSYGVNEKSGLLDYDEIRKLAKTHRPTLIIAGASAYPRKIDFEQFSAIAKEVSAKLFVDMAHIAGLVAAKLHPSPIPFADYVSSTTHKTLRGPRGGLILCKAEHQKNIDSRVFPGSQGGPLMHVIAAKAVAFKEALKPNFVDYQKQIIKNAQELSNALQEHGFNVLSGGTDNHMVLVDLRNKDISGAKAEEKLGNVGIIVNKNKIPYDPMPATVTSGIRVGTPALTTRGLREDHMRQVAMFIASTIDAKNENEIEQLHRKVNGFIRDFPIFA